MDNDYKNKLINFCDSLAEYWLNTSNETVKQYLEENPEELQKVKELKQKMWDLVNKHKSKLKLVKVD